MSLAAWIPSDPPVRVVSVLLSDAEWDALPDQVPEGQSLMLECGCPTVPVVTEDGLRVFRVSPLIADGCKLGSHSVEMGLEGDRVRYPLVRVLAEMGADVGEARVEVPRRGEGLRGVWDVVWKPVTGRTVLWSVVVGRRNAGDYRVESEWCEGKDVVGWWLSRHVNHLGGLGSRFPVFALVDPVVDAEDPQDRFVSQVPLVSVDEVSVTLEDFARLSVEGGGLRFVEHEVVLAQTGVKWAVFDTPCGKCRTRVVVWDALSSGIPMDVHDDGEEVSEEVAKARKGIPITDVQDALRYAGEEKVIRAVEDAVAEARTERLNWVERHDEAPRGLGSDVVVGVLPAPVDSPVRRMPGRAIPPPSRASGARGFVCPSCRAPIGGKPFTELTDFKEFKIRWVKHVVVGEDPVLVKAKHWCVAEEEQQCHRVISGRN